MVERRTSTNGPKNKRTHDDTEDFTSQRRHRQTVCVKKRNEEDFPAFKIALMQWYINTNIIFELMYRCINGYIQTDHLISARRPDQVLVKKKQKNPENLPNRGLCHAGRSQSKTERRRKERYIVINKRGERLMIAIRNSTDNTSINWTEITGKQKWEIK